MSAELLEAYCKIADRSIISRQLSQAHERHLRDDTMQSSIEEVETRHEQVMAKHPDLA